VSPGDLPLSTSTVNSSPEIQEEDSPPKLKRDRTKNRTPRPANSFILYRREKHVEIMAQYKGVKTLNNNVISKIVASMWRSETPEVKAHFSALAEAEKRAHLLKYPDYKYRPRKSATKKGGSVSKKSSPNRAKDPALADYQNPMYSMPWNVHSYQSLELDNGLPLLEQTEVERGFQFKPEHSSTRFPTFETPGFMPEDHLLDHNEYEHTWNMGAPSVWDMGLGNSLEGNE